MGLIRTDDLNHRRVPVNVPVDRKNFHPDIDAIRSSITDRTRMIMVNSPCNPTGAVYTREEIEEIVSIAIENDLWIISDEIYSRLIWNGGEHVSPATIEGGKERTIVISGWSKTWAMTGMRVGFSCRTPTSRESRCKMPSQLSLSYTHIHDGGSQGRIRLR